MADDTTPSAAAILPTVIRLRATIDSATGTLTLAGEGYREGVIEVPTGTDVIVKLLDNADYFLYATQVPSDGTDTRCWSRNTKLNKSKRKFVGVNDILTNIVFATDKKKKKPPVVIYGGPIIIIRPQG